MFTLKQNYPNPFNPLTNINYEISKDAFITLQVYDPSGKEIFNICEFKEAGSYDVTFDGSDLASGMYFYTFEVRQAGSAAIEFKDTKKMALIK